MRNSFLLYFLFYSRHIRDKRKALDFGKVGNIGLYCTTNHLTIYITQLWFEKPFLFIIIIRMRYFTQIINSNRNIAIEDSCITQ